jgi:hypothetical protein
VVCGSKKCPLSEYHRQNLSTRWFFVELLKRHIRGISRDNKGPITDILYYRRIVSSYAAARRQKEREVVRAVKLLKQN